VAPGSPARINSATFSGDMMLLFMAAIIISRDGGMIHQ
jgi:hypothetical protein